jgi:hypothetical protein
VQAEGAPGREVWLQAEALSGGELAATAIAGVWGRHSGPGQNGALAVWAQPKRLLESGRAPPGDGVVRIDFPSGALSQPTQVTYQRQAATLGNPLRFELSTDGQAVFGVSAQVTITAPEWISATLAHGIRPVLGQASTAPGGWSLARAQVDAGTGTMTAPLSQAGVLEARQDLTQGWQLAYQPPVVGLFSGAVTFDYPIEVPAGRNGLEPGLSLSYNSRGVDGRLGARQVGGGRTANGSASAGP